MIFYHNSIIIYTFIDIYRHIYIYNIYNIYIIYICVFVSVPMRIYVYIYTYNIILMITLWVQMFFGFKFLVFCGLIKCQNIVGKTCDN